MKLRGWLVLIAFSVIGYVATFLIFPRVMDAARWRHTVDHDSAIAIAKNAARQFGVEDVNLEAPGTGLGLADVEAEYSRRREHYLAAEPTGVGQAYFTPVHVNIKLLDFKTKRRVSATINSNGKLLGFDTSIPQDRKADDENKDQPDKVSDADTQLAESTIQTLFGDGLSSAKLSESSVTRQGSRFVWKTEDQRQQVRMKLLAKVLVRDGKVKQVSLDPEYTSLFDSEFDKKRSTLFKALSNSEGVSIWLPIFLIAIFFFVGVALKRIQHKQALIFMAAVFVLITVFTWLGGVTVGIDEGTSAGGSFWVVKFFS